MRWLFLVASLSLGNLLVGYAFATSVSQTEMIAALKSGGHVLLLRHAQTVPGVGDPPNFKLTDCTTQRNLSEEGRSQAKRIGEALRTQGVAFARTMTSQWCRCKDTASLISKSVEDFPPLNSFFDNRGDEPKQSVAVKRRTNTMPVNESWLMVTHQVNVTALTGMSPAMGEGVVVRVVGGTWAPLGLLTLDATR
jgi:phosphohistidine phosphatase SixA